MTLQSLKSPPRWPQPLTEELSDREAEHRLTSLETTAEHHEKRLDDHNQRMTFLEKSIMTIAAVLYVSLQDKFPVLAGIIKSLVTP